MKNGMFNNKLNPNIYVLMRFYCPEDADELFYRYLNSAIESIAKSKYYGKVILIVNDDTPDNRASNGYLRRLNDCLKENGFISGGGKCYLEKTNGKGSAFATFHIRQKFLEFTEGDDDAIAVMLDQDDCLKIGALQDIAEKMRKADIVISPFEIFDDKDLDITDDAGCRHNRLTRKIAFNWLFRRYRIACKQNFISKPKYETISLPRDIFEVFRPVKCLGNNFKIFAKDTLCRLQNSWAGIANLPDLSSIGWTKSYRRSTLKKYHDDLSEFLNTKRGDVEQFFSNHRAYEDFIDFYVFLLEDCRISGVFQATHIYRKHENSITSTPKTEDFQIHRPAMLIALMDLCYYNSDDLRPDYRYKLLRFISTKVYQIEHILSKYRNDFYIKGDKKYAEIAAKTHNGYFIDKFCCLALNENRHNEQDEILFRYTTARGEDSKDNIWSLFSIDNLNGVIEYHLTLCNSDSLRLRFLEVVECEKRLAKKKDKTLNEEDEIIKLIGSTKVPQQVRLNEIRMILLSVILFLIVIVFALYRWYKYDSEWIKNVFEQLIIICGVFLSFLLNEHSKVKSLIIEEKTLIKLYYSEFVDFIRHLEANAKVMIQLRKEIKESPLSLLRRVEDIHFINLSWPESSCLFSDDMAKIISKRRVNDFARLKVNLRNINNSARWLQSVASSSQNNLLRDLEWEIARYMGYLANMYYIKSHGFSFPETNELNMFLEKNSVKNHFTSLFMDYPAEERSELVDMFVRMYKDDRNVRRDVLIL